MKCNYFFLLIFIHALVGYGQIEKQQVDSLREIASKNLAQQGKMDQAIQVSLASIAQAKKINYQEGIAYGYYRTAVLLCTWGEYRESINYLNIAQSMSSGEDKIFNARIDGELARSYNLMGLHVEAIKLYFRALAHLSEVTSADKQAEKEYLTAVFLQNQAVSLYNVDNPSAELSKISKKPFSIILY